MFRNKYYIKGLAVLLFAALLFSGRVCPAQEAGEANIPLEEQTTGEASSQEEEAFADNADDKSMSILQLINKGGIVGYFIILLSFVATGLVIDYALTIRKSKLLPSRDIAVLRKLINDRRFEEIKKLDNDKTSFLARIVIAGIKEANLGYEAVIKAVEDSSEALSAGISRKIEHLNVIGNISPMLGLLGTVIGMLRCFNEISQVTGAIEPKQLAGGIFEALVTTCMGLIVAIPSLYFYAIFRNRIDEFTGKAALEAEELMIPLKPGSREN
jgi:biopolymer transport protein ExbB